MKTELKLKEKPPKKTRGPYVPRQETKYHDEQRRALISNLLAGGHSIPEVLAALQNDQINIQFNDVTMSQIRKDIKVLFDRLDEEQLSNTMLHRRIHVNRNQQMRKIVFRKALDGDISAVNTLIAIDARESKLCNLDAPIKTAFTNADGSQIHQERVNKRQELAEQLLQSLIDKGFALGIARQALIDSGIDLRDMPRQLQQSQLLQENFIEAERIQDDGQ